MSTLRELYAAYRAIGPEFDEFDRDDSKRPLTERANDLRAALVRLDGLIARYVREQTIDEG